MAFTFFFRDKQTLDLTIQYTLPFLKRRRYINVWDAGCAMGPEPYSFAILLRENMGPFLFRNVRIFASDIDESDRFGEIIKNGVYSDEQIKRIPQDIITRYFTPNGSPDHFQISSEILKAVQFYKHDLLSLKPIREEFGLIICKNVLLHFQANERIKVIEMFHHSLSDDGFLVMEQTQKMPPEVQNLFSRVTDSGQIFQKVSFTAGRVLPIAIGDRETMELHSSNDGNPIWKRD